MYLCMYACEKEGKCLKESKMDRVYVKGCMWVGTYKFDGKILRYVWENIHERQ